MYVYATNFLVAFGRSTVGMLNFLSGNVLISTAMPSKANHCVVAMSADKLSSFHQKWEISGTYLCAKSYDIKLWLKDMSLAMAPMRLASVFGIVI